MSRERDVADVRQSDTWETLRLRLNPTRVAFYELNESKIGATQRVDPATLLSESHFGFAAKHLYARLRGLGVAPTWAKKVYESHVYAFNRFDESDGTGKRGSEQFQRRFDALLDSIEKNGFDETQTVVPVTKNRFVLDGGHRVAACLYYKRDITILEVEAPTSLWDFRFFRRHGMPASCMDDVALEFLRIDKGLRIATLCRTSRRRCRDVEEALRRRGAVYFEKRIYLNKLGAANCLQQIRSLGGADLPDAAAATLGSGRATIHVFVWKPFAAAGDNVLVPYADEICFTTSHDSTMELARHLLNQNTIEFWCNVRPRAIPALEMFGESLLAGERENYCLSGNTALAVHGLVDFTATEWIGGRRHTAVRNAETGCKVCVRDLADDEIVFNPENHFYHCGLKVATLSVLRRSAANQWLSRGDKWLLTLHLLRANVRRARTHWTNLSFLWSTIQYNLERLTTTLRRSQLGDWIGRQFDNTRVHRKAIGLTKSRIVARNAD